MMKGGFDSEYASLMAELGETTKGPGGADSKPWTGSAGHDITAGGSNIPPWRRPEVWQTSIPPVQNQGYRPPQGGYAGSAGYSGGSGYSGYPPASYSGGQGYYQQPQDYSSANYAQYYQSQYSQQTA